MRTTILVYPGFDELDAIGPFEVLSMAARRIAASARAAAARPRPEWRVDLAAIAPAAGDVDGAEGADVEVLASNGLRLTAARFTGAPAAPDLLIVPGGGWVDRSRIGAWSEYERGDGPGTVARIVRDAFGRGTLVASVCTGALLLARAGILVGRRAITHHAAIDDLEKHGVIVVRARVVDDGDIVTAGGVTSGIDLALHLVERFAGADLATSIAETLEYAPAH